MLKHKNICWYETKENLMATICHGKAKFKHVRLNQDNLRSRFSLVSVHTLSTIDVTIDHPLTPPCGRGDLLVAHSLRQLLKSLLQLQRKLLVTFLTHRLHVKFHKLVPKTQIKFAFRSVLLTHSCLIHNLHVCVPFQQTINFLIK